MVRHTVGGFRIAVTTKKQCLITKQQCLITKKQCLITKLRESIKQHFRGFS